MLCFWSLCVCVCKPPGYICCVYGAVCLAVLILTFSLGAVCSMLCSCCPTLFAHPPASTHEFMLSRVVITCTRNLLIALMAHPRCGVAHPPSLHPQVSLSVDNDVKAARIVKGRLERTLLGQVGA